MPYSALRAFRVSGLMAFPHQRVAWNHVHGKEGRGSDKEDGDDPVKDSFAKVFTHCQ